MDVTVILPQKAVRVTTIMKRLRTPEQSESRSTGPTTSPSADPTAPQAATDPPAPSSGVQGPPATELSAAGEVSHPAPEAEPSAEGPQQPNPERQGAEPTSRCNGEAPAAFHTAAEATNEQG